MTASLRPESVVLHICPICGRVKPPAWSSDQTECYGEWKSNFPLANRGGKTSDHDPTPFEPVVYVLKGHA